MAIWQFQCNIAPKRENMAQRNGEEKISWKGIESPHCEIVFLAEEKSWSKDILQFGKTDETCIQFIYTENTLDRINCRLDLRSLTKDKLEKILQYVESINAVFIYEEKSYPPQMKKIDELLKKSKAYEYCKDPVKFLESIERNYWVE